MKAADSWFGKVGFEAATTREIAELSGVNKALIHYYFESKEALFHSLLDRYYEKLKVVLFKAMKKRGSMRDKMIAVIDSYMDFLEQNRNFGRIVQREASGSKHTELILHHMIPLFQIGMEWITQAYPSTRYGHLSSPQLLISFYGMIITYFTYSGILEHLVSAPHSEKGIKERKHHLHKMLDIVVAALEAEKQPSLKGKGKQKSKRGGKR